MFRYTYTLLRYVHDTTTGEFVNVGVAIFSPDAHFVGARLRHTYGRVAKTFPGVDGEAFKSAMRFIERRFSDLQERFETQLPLTDNADIMPIARGILPADDSSLQWSPFGSGVTNDPRRALEALYMRMVMRYERTQYERRTDEEVWRTFKRELEDRRLDTELQPKTIAVNDDEVEFQYAWKNGIWHCLEPLSFDLSSPDNIREKAHRWLGQMTSVRDASERFKVYFLVGGPQSEELLHAFSNAVSILHKAPVAKEIFLESDVAAFSEWVEEEIATHRQSS